LAAQILKTPIEYLKGVGPQKGEVLKKELGIFTYGDLLQHYPFRYIDRTRFYKIKELNGDLPAIQVIGRVIAKEIIGEKRGRRLVAQIKDDTGILELVWFQSIAWIDKNLKPGSAYIVFGKPSVFNSRISISHPEMELYGSQENKQGNVTLQPVYSSTEKLKQFFLDTRGLQRIQSSLLDLVLKEVDETLPLYILQKHELVGRTEALLDIHFPSNAKALQNAITRLKFEELFYIQLKLLKNKLLRTQKYKGLVFDKVGDKFNTFY